VRLAPTPQQASRFRRDDGARRFACDWAVGQIHEAFASGSETGQYDSVVWSHFELRKHWNRVPAMWCCLALDGCGPLRTSALSPVMSSGTARVLAATVREKGRPWERVPRAGDHRASVTGTSHRHDRRRRRDRTGPTRDHATRWNRDPQGGEPEAAAVLDHRRPAGSQAEARSGSKTASVRLATVKRVKHPRRMTA
jgi:hypothetical protein